MKHFTKQLPNLNNPSIAEVVSIPLKLAKTATCGCQQTHTYAIGVFDFDGNFWYNCVCGSTHMSNPIAELIASVKQTRTDNT